MRKKSFFVTVVLNNAIWLSGVKGIHQVWTDSKYSGEQRPWLTLGIVLAVIVAYRIYRRVFWRYFD